jgi:excisionase family DNA binding protein
VTQTHPPHLLRHHVSPCDTECMSEPGDELLTPDQAARLLGVTKRTIYRWVAVSFLPAIRVPRRNHFGCPVLRLRRSDVERPVPSTHP